MERTMFRIAALLGLIGLAVATGMIVWSGWAQVLQALTQAGWGISAVALFHLLPLIVSAAGWRVLIVGKHKPSLSRFVFFMWVRAAVNNLMPVARIGGEIAAVRLMMDQGMRRSIAIASTVVELTLSIAAIFIFVTVGVLLFAWRVNNPDSVLRLAWGVVFALPLLMALAAVQKIGFFSLMLRLFRLLFRDTLSALATTAVTMRHLDRAVALIYRRHRRVMIGWIMQFAAWSLGAVDIWLCLYFLGHPLHPLETVMIEALIQGATSVAFAIPGALGVQEAGFILFGHLLGLPREIAAALAVIRRCRDLLCYLPALLIWQMHEAKRLLKS